MQNCFQNAKFFYWTKLISVLIHLKHWYYDSPYLELPTTLVMFFIGFPILSYPIQPNATTSIGYTKSYGKSSQSNLLSSCLQIIISYGLGTLPIKKVKSLRTAFLSKIDNSVNSNSIFNTKYAEFFTKL